MYTPTVLASTSSFTGWRMLDTFRGGMPTLLIYLAAFCSVGRATEVGFRRICFRLYPFSLKVVLWNSVSSLVGWLDWLEPAFFLDSSPLKMRRIVCPKMSVRNWHYSLRNSPDKSSSQSTHPSTEASCSPCCTFPRHQSVLLPCRCEVLFTTLPQHCCMINIAFVYTLPTNYDVIHTQSPIVIQLWFMHDKHLTSSDAASAIQFTQT